MSLLLPRCGRLEKSTVDFATPEAGRVSFGNTHEVKEKHAHHAGLLLGLLAFVLAISRP